MDLISTTTLLYVASWGAGVALAFWLGRAFERSLWMPGKGLHLIGVGAEERVWVVRHDSKVPDFQSRDIKGWSELTAVQRDRALRRDGPPKTIGQARDFLYEIREDGTVTGSVGPTEEEGSGNGRYRLSFEREGGY